VTTVETIQIFAFPELFAMQGALDGELEPIFYSMELMWHTNEIQVCGRQEGDGTRARDDRKYIWMTHQGIIEDEETSVTAQSRETRIKAEIVLQNGIFAR
jgi:hypothetical protein